MLGLINLNYDKNELGISLLAKSKDLYDSIKMGNYPD